MKKARRVLSLVIVLMMVLSSAAFSVSAEVHYELELGAKEALVFEAGKVVTYQFTPSSDGWYAFYSESAEGNDPFADLYDSESEWLAYSDDYNSEENSDFRIVAKLKEGETYFLMVSSYVAEGAVCETSVCVEKAAYPVSAKVVSYPDDTEAVEGFEWSTADLTGLEIEYTLSDGSKWLWKGYEDYVNGIPVDYYNDDLSEDGKEYYIDIVCAESYTKIRFDVIENPVDKIVYVGDPIVCYYEVDGTYEYDVNDNEYFEYEWEIPEDSYVKIYFKDGTSVVCDENEDNLKGYVNFYDHQWEEHWGLGNYAVYADYLGAECIIPVSVIKSPIASIEITKNPAKTVYEGRYYPIWDGAEITLNMTDGTKKSAVLGDDNTEYSEDYYGELLYTVNVGGYDVDIFYVYDNETDTEYYSLDCLGATLDYYGFEFTDSRDVLDITVEDFSSDGYGMTALVAFGTGETEEFEFNEIIYSYDDYDYYYGFVKTDNGIAWYSIEADNDMLGYWLWFHGVEVFIDSDEKHDPAGVYIYGDADYNATVNIKDATIIQKHTAGLVELSEIGKILADVDLNDIINVKDATAIQKWIAGIETGYPIGDYIY